MKKLLFITVFILMSAGTIDDPGEELNVSAFKKEILSDEPQIKKHGGKSVSYEPNMDGVVMGKGMELAEDGTGEIKYMIYIRTNKGLLKKFWTTESNYNTLQKGYSVHYVLTGSGKYKMIEYRAPE